MAYVSVPKDIRQMKVRSMLKMTKRQLIVYGITLAIAAPIFFIVWSFGGMQPAIIALIFMLIPGFFISMYEKNGMKPEELLKLHIRRKHFYPIERPYVVEKLPAKILKSADASINKKGFAANKDIESTSKGANKNVTTKGTKSNSTNKRTGK